MNNRKWFCYFSVGFFSFSLLSSVNEADFNDINHVLVDIYAPMVAKKLDSTIELKELYDDFGGAFKVDSARKLFGEKAIIVTMTGDKPQSELMTKDGYAIVLCHELGHILGGEPRQKNALVSWSSVEGQADFYATNECMWNYVKNMPSTNVIHHLNPDMIARCEESFGKDIDKMQGCLTIISGIQAMVDYFNSVISKDQHISIKQRDPTVVAHTLQKYPSLQCRADTWIAGLFNEPRPRCWYKE